MNNGVLSKILSKLGADYGDDAARKIVSNYGDDIAKRGANSFLSKAVDGAQLPPTMVAYHGVPTSKLKMAAAIDDYVVNPSIQIVDPAKNMGGDYGEIVLLANKDLVNPLNRNISTYNRDIYSPRVPEIDENGMIAGTKKFASAQSLSDHMNKKRTVGGENLSFATPGMAAANNAKKFKSIRDIVENQQHLGEYNANRAAFDTYQDDLSNLIGTMATKHGDSYYSHMTAEEDLMDILKGKQPFSTYDDSIMQQAQGLRSRIKDLPTDYYETKVTRPVRLNEFSGAMLPNGFDDPKVMEMLQRNNIPVVSNYDPKAYINDMNQNGSLQNELIKLSKKNRFTTPYLLGGAGALPILGSLFSGSSDNNQV